MKKLFLNVGEIQTFSPNVHLVLVKCRFDFDARLKRKKSYMLPLFHGILKWYVAFK